jgi:hypothetical protein
MGCNCGGSNNQRPHPSEIENQRAMSAEEVAAARGDSEPTPSAPPATGGQ